MFHTPLNSSESLPAVPDAITIPRFDDVPQRTDYVPPVVPSNEPIDGELIGLLMAIHKFVEVNAVLPEHHRMADDLRRILEGR